MNEQDEANPLRHITWRTQITIRAEKHGLISHQTVTRAITGIHTVAPIIDIVIVGGCNIVDIDAAMPLGHFLNKADQVNVTAHGPGVPDLLGAIRHAIRYEQEFLAELRLAQHGREQTSPYDPWQSIGDKA